MPTNSRDYMRQWRLNHPEYREYEKIYRKVYRQRPEVKAKQVGSNGANVRHNTKARLEAYSHYSTTIIPSCVCCGEQTILFLTIDHINNNGAEERKLINHGKNGRAGSAFYSWLKRQNYPEGYQLMCYNCNMGRYRNGGICPHKVQI